MTGSYLIKNATVVSVDSSIGVVNNCDVLIKDGIIASVARDIQALPGSTVIDGTDAMVSPGFVDTHRHTWQTQLRTTTADYVLTDYVTNIRNIWGSCYTPHDVYVGNYCGALESVDNGITFLIDHSHIMNSPEHADAAVKGLKDSNIRAVFCYGLYENPSWEGSCIDKELGDKNPNWRLEDARRIKETYFKSNQPTDLVRFGFAPAEIERGTIQQAIDEVEFGRSLNAAVITGHVAMGKYDRGVHLVRHFQEENMLGPDLLLSHCAGLQDDELQAVSKNGVSLSSTPDTELQMGMGHPIAFKAREQGCCASIGIDITSNNPADMFQQMRLLIQAQRHLENEGQEGPRASVARRCAEVLEMATMGGAEAVGLKDVIGSITPGKRADLLITRCDSTRLTPVHDPIAALVLYANGSDIDTVFIDGKPVKSGGKFVDVNWPSVRGELRDSAKSIMTRSMKAPRRDITEGVATMMQAFAGTGQPKIKLSS
jgi:cytosine/adenosine deaminase-related metal-dependent hydrolase